MVVECITSISGQHQVPTWLGQVGNGDHEELSSMDTVIILRKVTTSGPKSMMTL